MSRSSSTGSSSTGSSSRQEFGTGSKIEENRDLSINEDDARLLEMLKKKTQEELKEKDLLAEKMKAAIEKMEVIKIALEAVKKHLEKKDDPEKKDN